MDRIYFSHDASSAADPKIVALIAMHGFAGYGRFWRILEIMRESADYKLPIGRPFMKSGLAGALQLKVKEFEDFINDLINLELFETDGLELWSKSFLRRMAKKDEIREKRREAGKKRALETEGEGEKPEANDQQMVDKSSANGQQIGTNGQQKPIKERKRKERKGKEREPAPAESPDANSQSKKVPFEMILAYWNETVPNVPVSDTDLTPYRKKQIAARWKSHPDLGFFLKAFEAVRDSNFLSGRKTDFRADLFWITKSEEKLLSVVGGRYSNSTNQAKGPSGISDRTAAAIQAANGFIESIERGNS